MYKSQENGWKRIVLDSPVQHQNLLMKRIMDSGADGLIDFALRKGLMLIT
jgi:hypothetical protein